MSDQQQVHPVPERLRDLMQAYEARVLAERAARGRRAARERRERERAACEEQSR